MKITKIERQKKNTDRYSLYVDHLFWIGVHENVLIQFGLYKAQPVTKELLEEIFRAEYLQSIYVKAIHFLSYGLKTIDEVRKYLEKFLSDRAKEEQRESNELDAEYIEQAIEKLISQKYLDDLVYSQSYVRTQATLSQKGTQRIKWELSKKGVDNDIIDCALGEYPYQLQRENAQILIEKYMRIKQQQYSEKKLKEKIREMLSQKGFERELIDDAMMDVNDLEDESFEFNLLDKEAHKQLRKWQKKHEGYTLKQKVIESLMRKGFNYRDIQMWIVENEAVFIIE